jgi:hypothetical protein
MPIFGPILTPGAQTYAEKAEKTQAAEVEMRESAGGAIERLSRELNAAQHRCALGTNSTKKKKKKKHIHIFFL